MEQAPPPMDRRRVKSLYLPLVVGPLLLAAVTAYLLRASGPVGRQPSHPLVAWLMGVWTLGLVLAAWFWARPQVQIPAPGMDAEAFWRQPLPGGRALIAWILLEGGLVISLVGTLVTGSGITAGASVTAFLFLLLLSPRYFESR